MKNTSTIMTSLAKRVGAIALCTTLGMATVAGTAYAYFTSNSFASGGHSIQLGYSSELIEDIDEGNKIISMQNTGSADIMVRVQLFYGTGVNNNITVTVAPGEDQNGQHWYQENGVWVWSGVLAPGQSTGHLYVNVKAVGEVDLSNFDVTVIGQTSLVEYNEENQPVASFWKAQD